MSKNFGTMTVGYGCKPVSLEDIAAAVEAMDQHSKRVAESLHEELKKWMLDQGFDPDKRCFLVLPAVCAQDLPSWPKFVRFSPYIDSATLVRDVLGLL